MPDGSDNGSSRYGSRENLRPRRSQGGSQSGGLSRSADGMYRPGQPIGFLAARGTPYEKKYLTKKLGFCCKVIAPIIVIPVLVIALVPIVWAIANHTLHVAQLHVMEANLTSLTNSSFPLSLNAAVSLCQFSYRIHSWPLTPFPCAGDKIRHLPCHSLLPSAD